MDRTLTPPVVLPSSLEINHPEKITLNNGVELYWLKDTPDEAVKLEIVWPAGTKYQNKALVASMTNRLLLGGTAQMSENDLLNEIDIKGGYFQRSIDKDHAGVILFGLAEKINEIFGTFRKGFEHAIFPESILKNELRISKQKFKVDQEKVKILCHRLFNAEIFGKDNPYGRIAELGDYDRVERIDLENFYIDHYRQTLPTIFLVGNVDDSLINELNEFTKCFEVIKANKPTLQTFPKIGKRIHEEKKGAIQSALRIGKIMFRKDHKDYFDFQILNTILGGYFGSRLMANIREDKGYTYGIGSGMAVLEEVGYFFIATEVGSDVREEAISEILKEINRLRTELIPEDELRKVQNYLVGDFLRQTDGIFNLMEAYKNIHFNQVPLTYYDDFVKAIHKVDNKRLMELAKQYLKEEDLLIASAG